MKSVNYQASKWLLYLVLVISVFILFFTASISYKRIEALTQSEKTLIHMHQVTAQLELLASTVKEAESSMRGFIISKDSSFISAYEGAKGHVDEYYGILTLLTKGNEKEEKNLTTLKELVGERFYYLNKNFVALNDSLGNPQTNARRMLAGKKSMDMLLAKIASMKALEEAKLERKEIGHKELLSPFWILTSILFSLFIFICSFYKINRDLQKIKKANNQLMINKEIFEHTEQIAEISSWCLNLDSGTLTFSHNQFRLLGCEVHEFVPTIEKYIEFLHPDDRHIFREGRLKMLTYAEPAPIISYFRIIRKDGALRHFKSIEKKITDNYNNTIIIGINADITEQYLQEKIIEEKIFDLERSNNELSAFNHVASHDLQEPLRKVQTYISRIRDKDFETLSEKTQEYFVRIQLAANRMQKLIDDLLMFSRANKAEKVFVSTNLNEVLDHSKTELARLTEEKQAIIHNEHLPVISAIPFQVQQLFNNLIGNSLKYAAAGRTLTINISSKIITAKDISFLSHFNETKFHELTFADNGIGFEQQYADSIFKLFHRLHDNATYSGTGIGLTICKKIVENHKGFIRAYGTPDKGATFKIYLPA